MLLLSIKHLILANLTIRCFTMFLVNCNMYMFLKLQFQLCYNFNCVVLVIIKMHSKLRQNSNQDKTGQFRPCSITKKNSLNKNKYIKNCDISINFQQNPILYSYLYFSSFHTLQLFFSRNLSALIKQQEIHTIKLTKIS